MFISVDLPDPEAPTMATNSPRSIRSDTSVSARTVSPVGRVNVLPIAYRSILESVPCLHVAHQHLVAVAQTVDDLPMAVVPAAGGHRAPLDRLAASGEDERTITILVNRADRQRQNVLTHVERDADGRRHFGPQRSIARRGESDERHGVHDVVANLRLR